MKKRKKAASTPSRRARSGHIPGTGKSARTARAKPAKSRNHQPAVAPVNHGKAASGEPTVSLPPECTVSGASALKEQLAAVLEDPRCVTLDVSGLQRIDTAALQVITAFVRDRTGHDRQIEWRGSVPVLATAARLLGLQSALKLPS